MEKKQKYLIVLFRIFAGTVFIFSGFVKGVDITGSAIKFHDYFQAFHLGFLQFLALPMAFLLPFLEFLTGISLLFRFKPKAGIVSLVIFMLVFTPLTLILALLNPVKDCGCFGDALIITNWQTFWKNVILLIMAVYLYLKREANHSVLLPATQWVALAVFAIGYAFISFYSYKNLPVFDFRPYHAGASIPEGMTVPEDAPEDEYETTLIYEKNGNKKAFNMDNFPWEDSTWTFVEQRTKLVREGYIPPIHDFDIILPGGEDITRQVLEDQGYTFLLISPDIKKADPEGLMDAYILSIAATDRGAGFYLLTSSGDEAVRDVFDTAGIRFAYANTDETTLKTIIRSNPGLLLIRDGVILQKWPKGRIPDPTMLNRSMLSQSLQTVYRGRNRWFSLFLIVLILGAGTGMNRLFYAITLCRTGK